MKVILIRHGETIENKEGIITGHLSGKLSELGVQQARDIALNLKDEQIDHIFSSDLVRASDTAKEIARYHPNIPITFTRNLRERDWNKFQGLRKKDIPNWEKIKFNPELNGAEPLKKLYERTKLFIDTLGVQYPTGNILIVAHDFVNRALISVMSGKSWEYIEKIDKIPHVTVNIFNINIQNEDKNNNNK